MTPCAGAGGAHQIIALSCVAALLQGGSGDAGRHDDLGQLLAILEVAVQDAIVSQLEKKLTGAALRDEGPRLQGPL